MKMKLVPLNITRNIARPEGDKLTKIGYNDIMKMLQNKMEYSSTIRHGELRSQRW
jgi:hypothetical protein